MLKLLFLFLHLALFFNYSFAQSYKEVLKEYPIMEEHKIYVNSKTRLGGKNRIVLPVHLPPNTISWYYSFTTLKTDNPSQNIETGLKLSSQLAPLITKGAINASGAGIVSNIIYQVIKPTGSAVMDIYVTNKFGSEQFMQTDALGAWLYTSPGAYEYGKAENTQNGTYAIPIVNNELYLCLRNPSPTEGLLIAIDIVAIVKEKEYEDAWTNSSLTQLYNQCFKNFAADKPELASICDCYKSKFSSNYLPSNYNALPEHERNNIHLNYINECGSLTGNQSSLDNDKRIKELYEMIRGQAMIKDYINQEKSLQELLSLGVDNWNIYNSLGYCQLCNRNYEVAKQTLGIGLGKNPTDLYLLGNLANYYLLTGRYDQALQICIEHKNKKISEKMKFKEAVAEDLKEFESLGIANPDFDRLRKDLKIN